MKLNLICSFVNRLLVNIELLTKNYKAQSKVNVDKYKVIHIIHCIIVIIIINIYKRKKELI